MKEKLNKRKISLAILAASLVLLEAPVAVGATAVFNDNPNDLATIQVSNQTRNPGCSSCWGSSASADVGDTISFRVYYHNTSDTTAQNTRVRISSSLSFNGRTITATGQISADNAASVSENASVNVSGAATGLTLLSTSWFPDRATSPQSVPNGSNITGSGAALGDLPLDSVGFVLARFRIEGAAAAIGRAPDVNTLSATDIERTSARLRGEVNPNGDSTEAWFEWGTSSSNLNRDTSRQSMGSGNNFISFPQFVSGLEPNTDYFFRAVARNSFGTERGVIRSFTTGVISAVVAERPLVRVLPATNITRSSANIRGEVNPVGSATTAFLEWGTNPENLLNRTGTISVGSGNSFINISSFLSGLNANTLYHYRVVADNSAGRSISGVESFRTSSFAVVTPPSVITRVVQVVTGVPAVPTEEVVRLTLEADKTQVRDNRINYIVTYENLTNRTLRDASLEVNLPNELKFRDASRAVDEVRGNTLIFRIGIIRGGDREQIRIETDTEDLKAGDRITTAATLSYIDTNNVRYIVAVKDISEITKEDLTGAVGLTATISDALRDFFANPIFWLLVALALLYLIYRFLTARRQPPIYPPGAGTVVAYPPAGGPAVSSPGLSMHSAPPQTPPPVRPPEGPPFG